MKQIRLVAPLHNSTGYAKAGRAILAALLCAGYEVEAVESEVVRRQIFDSAFAMTETKDPAFVKRMEIFQKRELDAALAYRISADSPTLILNPPEGAIQYAEYNGERTLFSMWETDSLATHNGRCLQNADRVLLPSDWNRKAAAKWNPNSYTVPLCVDERCWRVQGDNYPLPNRPDFVFLAVHAISERKNWRELMTAFCEEFRGESVGLVIKCGKGWEPVKQLADWYKMTGAWVEVIHDDLSEEEIGNLYREADCLAAVGTEGFGMPIVEAALCGTPAVTIEGTATGEVGAELGAIAVKSYVAPNIGHLPYMYPPSHNIEKPDLKELRLALRRATEGEVALQGDALHDLAVQKFGRETIGGRLSAALNKPIPARISLPPVASKSLAVVMTTFNHIEETRRTLQSLVDTLGDTLIVAVDDGSTDGTQEFLEREGVKVLSGTGGNVSANRQKAVDWLISVEWIGDVLFTDNDVTYLRGWRDGVDWAFGASPKIGIVAPLKHLPNGAVQNCGNWLNWNGQTYPGRLLRPLVYCDYVESAAMVVRAGLWQKLKWDSQFPIFYEDVDVCTQAQELGFDVVATALSAVTHNAHTTSVSRESESDRNRKRYLKKWNQRQ